MLAWRMQRLRVESDGGGEEATDLRSEGSSSGLVVSWGLGGKDVGERGSERRLGGEVTSELANDSWAVGGELGGGSLDVGDEDLDTRVSGNEGVDSRDD